MLVLRLYWIRRTRPVLFDTAKIYTLCVILHDFRGLKCKDEPIGGVLSGKEPVPMAGGTGSSGNDHHDHVIPVYIIQ